MWVFKIIIFENFKVGDLFFIFCDDNYFYKLNVEFFNYDIFIDIIIFDYSLGKEIYGEIYILIERVGENVLDFNVFFEEEFYRVIIYGVFYLCGYKDKIEL